MRKRLTFLFLTITIFLINTAINPTLSTASANAKQPITVSGDGWRAEYYNNTTWGGEPVLVRTEPEIDYWWEGAPGPGVNEDFFSVIWRGTLNLDKAGTLHLTATPDDRMRVVVNQYEIIDTGTPGVIVKGDTELEAGVHTVTVEYVEYVGSALATLEMAFSAEPTQTTDGKWRAEYFANLDFHAPPKIVEHEADIAYDWGAAAPMPGMPTDNFSVRWTRTETIDAPMLYKITVTADDSIFVTVDGTVIIDTRNGKPWVTETAGINLQPGEHEIIVEFVEYTHYAFIDVDIERLPIEKAPP